MKPLVVFVVGPTAVGKSKIAIALAKYLNGEIVSADSMLVYRGMDIGTAKPSLAERSRIPHHLIDVISPQKNFSVFQYRDLALKKIKAIIRRDRIPIVTGGSGLYVRALLQGIAPYPESNPEIRMQLERTLGEEGGLAALYHRLCQLDPERAASVDSKNPRRVLRALEISIQQSIRPIKDLPKAISLSDMGYHPVVVGITKNRETLYADIEKRVDRMFKRGLVSEVRRLLRGKLSKTATQAVGYKEVIAFLNGEHNESRARELVKTNTRHLAKRQWTWFKREQGIQWIEIGEKELIKVLVKKIVNHFGIGK